jgi:hypothetical protein
VTGNHRSTADATLYESVATQEKEEGLRWHLPAWYSAAPHRQRPPQRVERVIPRAAASLFCSAMCLLDREVNCGARQRDCKGAMRSRAR